MDTAIKHFVPDRVKPSFAIFDIRALFYFINLYFVELKNSEG